MLTEALDVIFDAILISTKKNDICQHIIGTSFAIGPTIASTQPNQNPLPYEQSHYTDNSIRSYTSII